MKNYCIMAAWLLIFATTGCGSASNTESPIIFSEPLGEETTADEEDVLSAPIQDFEVKQESIEYEELKLAGIGLSIPKDWECVDASEAIYLGYDVYPDPADSRVSSYLQISFASMEDINAYPDSNTVVVAVANKVKEREGCTDYQSKPLSLGDINALMYECIISTKGRKEEGCLYPIGNAGVLSIFYSHPSDIEDLYSDSFYRLISSVDIPDESVILESARLEKAIHSSEEQNHEDEASRFSASDNNEKEEYKTEQDTFTDDSGHEYYKGIPYEGAMQADQVARQIAEAIMTNPQYTTDLQKVTAAAQMVADYCKNEVYGMDEAKYYRSPYGVFVARVYTCAGSTRALGRVLDFMGYSWTHQNENQNRHQWCVLTIDGQSGFADGMAGIAGYGQMTNGMVLPDGSTLHFSE